MAQIKITDAFSVMSKQKTVKGNLNQEESIDRRNRIREEIKEANKYKTNEIVTNEIVTNEMVTNEMVTNGIVKNLLCL